MDPCMYKKTYIPCLQAYQAAISYVKAVLKRNHKTGVLTEQFTKDTDNNPMIQSKPHRKCMYLGRSLGLNWLVQVVVIDLLNLYPVIQSSDVKPKLFAISTAGFALSVGDSDEYKLRQKLLRNMDVMVRPVTSSSDAVNVSFSLTVWALVDLVRSLINI